MEFPTVEFSDPALTPPGVHHATVQSPALRRRGDVSFFLPPGHEHQPLPLVLLLHGVYGSHWAWMFKGGAHETAMRFAAGGGQPFLLAMPSDGLWGDGSGYVKHASADYRSWIVDEVPALATRLAAVTSIYIAGLSMGGYGAMRLGALHPERFRGISSHSGVTDAQVLQRFLAEGRGEIAWADEDPASVIDCIRVCGPSLPPLCFDCGADDELLEANRALHHALDREGVPHQYEEYPGGHDWDYWRAHLERSLHFFAEIERQS